MGFIKKRTNKKFDYKPRYFDGDNPYQINHKFDEFRTTIEGSKSFKEKIQSALQESETSGNRGFNKTILIIITVLVFIFLYIIDFDLSIFKKPF